MEYSGRGRYQDATDVYPSTKGRSPIKPACIKLFSFIEEQIIGQATIFGSPIARTRLIDKAYPDERRGLAYYLS
jgi:hypothetical protein